MKAGIQAAGVLLIAGAIYAQDNSAQEKSVKEQIEALQAKMDREGILITIEKKNATVQEIVDEFRRQAGINIIVDMTRVPDDFRIKDFVLKNVAFKEAFAHFLKLAGMVITEETASVIKIERPALITIDVKKSPISEVLLLIAKLSGASIIFSEADIQGEVTLSVSDIPWFELVDMIARTKDYITIREKYNVIRIIKSSELLKQLEIRTWKLKYVMPPPSYRAKMDVTTSKYVAGAIPKIASSTDEMLKEFPFMRIIDSVLSKDSSGKKVGELQYDVQTNSIVVKDVRPVLETIQKIIDNLDVEPDQVIIDLKFVLTTNSDLLQFGVDYFGTEVFGDTGTTGFSIKTTASAPGMGAVDSKFPFAFGPSSKFPDSGRYFLSNYQAGAILRMFKQDKFSQIIQQPTIAALDGVEATIFVGESVPYAVAESSTVSAGTTTVTVKEADKSPVKTGFQMLVIPRIVTSRNAVIMTIIPQNIILSGSQKGFEVFKVAGQEISLPRTSESTVVTKLMIEDGRTAIIGGLTIENVTFEDRGFPILKDIPVIGYGFKFRNDNKSRQNLLVFITPRIVKNERVSQAALEAKMKQAEDAARHQLEKLKKGK